MLYSMQEVKDQFSLPASTLHYYERIGILPTVQKNESGHRMYTERDIEWLKIILCMRGTGIGITKIKAFMELVKSENDSAEQKYLFFAEQKKKIEEQYRQLDIYLETVEKKMVHYSKKMKETN